MAEHSAHSTGCAREDRRSLGTPIYGRKPGKITVCYSGFSSSFDKPLEISIVLSCSFALPDQGGNSVGLIAGYAQLTMASEHRVFDSMFALR